MRKKGCWAILGLLCLLGASPAFAIPARMFIGGQLLDQNGQPVHYYSGSGISRIEISVVLPAKIMLYDSATAPTAFDTILTTATAYNGNFSISFIPPDSAIVKSSLWYSLAIDANRNGLDSGDTFPDRFEIGSVPFALSAKPITFYTTFGGSKGGATIYYLYSQIMEVVPFETPPGGIQFNQMNIILAVAEAAPNNAFSFGIYDEQGKLVISSGLIELHNTNASISDAYLQVKHAKITLQPSKIYYVGLARNNRTMGFPLGLRPAAPIMGRVAIASTTGLIPNSFNPDSIDPTPDATPLPVTLCLVDDTTPKPGEWIKSKTGGSQYRLILTKTYEKTVR